MSITKPPFVVGEDMESVELQKPDFRSRLTEAHKQWSDADLMSYLYPRYAYGYRYQLSDQAAEERKREYESHRRSVEGLFGKLAELVVEELIDKEDRVSTMRTLSEVARGGRLKQLVMDEGYRELINGVLGNLQRRLGDKQLRATEVLVDPAPFIVRDEIRAGIGANLEIFLERLAPAMREKREEINATEKEVYRLAGLAAANCRVERST